LRKKEEINQKRQKNSSEREKKKFETFIHKSLRRMVVTLYAKRTVIHSIRANKIAESLTKTFQCVKVLLMNVKGEVPLKYEEMRSLTWQKKNII
jgi:hypothetical protein